VWIFTSAYAIYLHEVLRHRDNFTFTYHCRTNASCARNTDTLVINVLSYSFVLGMCRFQNFQTKTFPFHFILKHEMFILTCITDRLLYCYLPQRELKGVISNLTLDIDKHSL
jgi:hypothetical protein